MAAPPEEQQPLEPLKYQTWVLKVSIHCEGCKRKVKRILQSIEGVYMISIDSKQQKVTVTGNVEPEALIKKLMRNGKHAEMWPMNPAENDQKLGNDNRSNGGGEDTEAEDSDPGEGQQPPPDHQHGVRFFLGDQRPPNPNMMMQMGPLQGQVMPPPMNPNGGTGAGGPKKKKKKKKKKSGAGAAGGGGGNNPRGPGGSGAPPLGPPQGHFPSGGVQMSSLPTCTRIQYQDLNGGHPNHSYPPQGHYPNQPTHMSTLTTPVYSMSYSAVQPGRSHGPSYQNQAMQPYSYAYDEAESYAGPAVPFDMINDENPNWCSIM